MAKAFYQNKKTASPAVIVKVPELQAPCKNVLP